MSDEQCSRCGYLRNEETTCRCGNLKSPSELAAPPGSEDGARLRFIQSLHTHDADGQRCLLAIESDAEIERLKSIAIRVQCFEAAAACAQEQKRRKLEVCVNPPEQLIDPTQLA